MSIANPYVQNQLPTQTGSSIVPSSYVNINATTPSGYSYIPNNGVFTKFVKSEQEVITQPNPIAGCAFYIDGDNLILYAKYADGRPMEIYDMVLREPQVPHYVTMEDLTKLLDSKFDELSDEFSKKFVIRRENRGGTNG